MMSNDRMKTYSSCLYNKAYNYTLWYIHDTMFVCYGASGQMYARTGTLMTIVYKTYTFCKNNKIDTFINTI